MTPQASTDDTQGYTETTNHDMARDATEMSFKLEDLIPGIFTATEVSSTAVSNESNCAPIQTRVIKLASGKLLSTDLNFSY